MSSIVAGLGKRWQNATLYDVAWLIACGLLFYSSKWLGKAFQGIPGHASAFWVPVLFLAIANIRRTGSSTLTAFLGGFLWTLPRANPLGIAPYLAAGLVLDAFTSKEERLRHLGWALVAGAACSLAKFSFHNIPAAILGSGRFLTWGLGNVAMLHAVFGLVGGLVGWLAIRFLSRQSGGKD